MTSPVVLARSRTVPVPVEHAFDVVLPTPLPDLFRYRYAAIPPISEVREQEGVWGSVGRTRTIVLADGATMREELTCLDRPHGFGYRHHRRDEGAGEVRRRPVVLRAGRPGDA